jgi:hypothetical protein
MGHFLKKFPNGVMCVSFLEFFSLEHKLCKLGVFTFHLLLLLLLLNAKLRKVIYGDLHQDRNALIQNTFDQSDLHLNAMETQFHTSNLIYIMPNISHNHDPPLGMMSRSNYLKHVKIMCGNICLCHLEKFG